jgi:hypothetical protein
MERRFLEKRWLPLEATWRVASSALAWRLFGPDGDFIGLCLFNLKRKKAWA